MRLVAAVLLLGMGTAMAGAQTQGAAALLRVEGVAYDAAGNLFIADANRNQVLELSLAGVMTVVAGTGEQGFGGDGGDARGAMLNAPLSVAVSADGTVYIADTGNQRVRMVFAGQISTLAGSDTRGFGGDGGTAMAAKLDGPAAVAVDAQGGLLIADAGNQRVRRVFGGVITTMAGSGVQGFSGDGGVARAAEMDGPSGLAVGGDGSVYVSDTRNQRVRVVGTNGVIRTLAGNGLRGFVGDGGAATGAELFLPRGLAMDSSGGLLIADAGNHRVRRVDAQGVIRTVAGNGVQGGFAEGAVASGSELDTPRAVALSVFGEAVFGDQRTRVVGEVASDAKMYAVAGGVVHPVTAAVSVGSPMTYGQGAAVVSVVGAGPVAEGSVVLRDGSAVVGTATLSSGAASVAVDGLSAGSHALTAAYAGDGLHAAMTSAASVVFVGQKSVTAVAAPLQIAYGGVAPVLTGNLSGVLPRDAAGVTATFATSAPDLADVGTYPVTVTLSGAASANYVLASTDAGTLTVVKAAPSVSLQAPAGAYAGLPVSLTAMIAPPTRGVPTGSVSFLDGGAVVASGSVVNGVATAVYLNPPAGARQLTAVYAGDKNFLGGSSAAAAVTVGAMPDFTLGVSGSAAQTVVGGGLASYTLQVVPAGSAFSGVVSFSASGLQSGATVSFSPTNVVPGASPVAVTMTVQTKALAQVRVMRTWELAGVLITLGLWRRRRRMMMLCGLVLLCGCGDRQFASSTTRASQVYPVLVTGTSTNLAGAVVMHTTTVTLTVQ